MFGKVYVNFLGLLNNGFISGSRNLNRIRNISVLRNNMSDRYLLLNRYISWKRKLFRVVLVSVTIGNNVSVVSWSQLNSLSRLFVQRNSSVKIGV